jgi:YfiH family protein
MTERPPGWLDAGAEAGWPAGVHGGATSRAGGTSAGPCASLDLGGRAQARGGDAARVAADRAALAEQLGVDAIRCLDQVHRCAVHRVPDAGPPCPAPDPSADGAVCRRDGVALCILVADCLPVLFADEAGAVVGAAHAGWRGLAAGVLEATVDAMGVAPGRVRAWLGPAIGPGAFEIGPEVHDALAAHPSAPASAFVRGRGDRWHADLWALARARLEAQGVGAVSGGGVDVHGDPARYFSHRRDAGRTGRQGALIWRRRAAGRAPE